VCLHMCMHDAGPISQKRLNAAVEDLTGQ